MFDYDKYCLEGEVWKDIPTYEGIYQASSFGRIRTVDGKTTYSIRHGVRKWKGKILKNKTKIPSKEGLKVSLWKENKMHDHLVSRLICSAFYGMPESFYSKNVKTKMTVNHKDGNRLNNKIENLEWITLKENIRHGFETGLYDKNKKQILLIRKDEREHFNSLSDASRWLGQNCKYVSTRMKRGSILAISTTGKVYTIKSIDD